jgi:hypothetical protein
VEGLPRLVRQRGIAASEYDTFARNAQSAGKHTRRERRRGSDAGVVWCQPAAKFSSSPLPSQGVIDDRQELRRCEYVALEPVRAADVSGGTHSGSGLTQGVSLAQKRMICACP